MKRDQYMGMDVHQATTVVAVVDAEGKRGVLPSALAASCSARAILYILAACRGSRAFDSA